MLSGAFYTDLKIGVWRRRTYQIFPDAISYKPLAICYRLSPICHKLIRYLN